MQHLYEQIQILEPSREIWNRMDRLRAANGPLLAWYRENARILPWREQPTPYAVWISEIMLQQTRVEAVKPYFYRFMKALPTVKTLSQVEEERLLKLWEGLGYYNRAKNLQKTAVRLVEEYGGELPSSYEELLKLPGIGSYTAGAIASIAFEVPVPAVDGNVLRVVSRILGSREDISKQSFKKSVERDLQQTMPTQKVGDFNQALIELGAIVCVPNGAPRCEECPLYSICLARQQNLCDVIPVKAPKKERRIEDMTVCILECGEQVAIKKRDESGLLASLYELPNFPGHQSPDEVRRALKLNQEDVVSIDALLPAKHIFSHVEWHMEGYHIRLCRKLPEAYLAVQKYELIQKYPLPNAFSKYTKLIK